MSGHGDKCTHSNKVRKQKIDERIAQIQSTRKMVSNRNNICQFGGKRAMKKNDFP